jgi:hypothetical protein
MELTPGERAVLAQIRRLCLDTRAPAHPLRAVMAEWPASHHEAYRSAFRRLFARSLIQVSADKQAFRVTDPGLCLLGLVKQKLDVPKRGVAPAKRHSARPKGLTGWLRNKLVRA